MKRLFCLVLCLMMLCTSALAEAVGTTAEFTGLYGLMKAVQNLEGGTIAVELPGMEPIALTLDPDRADFARIDLPGGALVATAEGLFLQQGENVRGMQWNELLDAAGISLEALASAGETLLDDAQTVGEALVKEFRLLSPVFATGTARSDFLSASMRIDAAGLIQVVKNVLTNEAEAIDRILAQVWPVLFGRQMTAARLLNEMNRLLYRSGAANLGEVFNMSYGASMVEDECSVTLLATIGPARLTVTVQDGKLSGELIDEDGDVVLTISGTMVIEDGMHANLVIAPVGEGFTPIRLHLAVTGDGFSGLITGEDFTLSAAYGEDERLNISLRAGSAVKLDFTVGSTAMHLGFTIPDFTLDAAYDQNRTWVADADSRYGGYYVRQPDLRIKSVISSTTLTLEANSAGLYLQALDRGSLYGAFQLDSAMQTIRLRLADTYVELTPQEAAVPGEMLINLKVIHGGEAHGFTLRFWRREGIPCIDVQQRGETLATIVLDMEGKYLPAEPAGEYAVTDPEALGEAIAEWLEAAAEELYKLAPAAPEAPASTEVPQ